MPAWDTERLMQRKRRLAGGRGLRTSLEKVGWNGARHFSSNPGPLEAPLNSSPLRAAVAGTGEHARSSDEKPALVGSGRKLPASKIPAKRLEL